MNNISNLVLVYATLVNDVRLDEFRVHDQLPNTFVLYDKTTHITSYQKVPLL